MSLSDELRTCANGRFGVKTNKDYMLRAADEIDLLQWRIENAMKASCLEGIDSPQEAMEMIISGKFDEYKFQPFEEWTRKEYFYE